MKLTEEQKTWLVMRWACYGRSHEIMRDFQETFGAQVPGNQARKYNLAGIRSDEEAKAQGVLKWMPLWRKSREQFEASVADIAIASQAFRIRKLDEMFEEAFKRKNMRTAMSLLEQAAKEMGGSFSSMRHLKADVAVTKDDDVPEDVKRNTLASHVRLAVEQALVAAAASTPTTH
jgi:hypothetical protein